MAAFHAKDRLLTAAQSYYNDEQYSDFVITCDNREFKVHRCFIAPHSKFFEKAFSGMFKETHERKVDLKEDDSSMVELMVKFFYTFDYDNTPTNSEISPLGLHARVYIIADKYEVLGLKSIALAKFKAALATSYKDGKAMVEVAHALTQCIPFPSCDPALHDLVSEAWLHGGDELFVDVGEAEIALLFAEVGWLSVTLASRMLKTLKSD